MAQADHHITQELTTIRDYLRWALSCFNEADLYYGHGTDNAWDEACFLVLRSLSLPMDIQPSLLEATLTQIERGRLFERIAQRVEKRIPVPYLLHEAWFAGLRFYVDEHVLIPRSPMAELIEQRFSPWIEEHQVTRILDLCTGSGCIAIACAAAFSDAQVVGSDLSAKALTVAKRNGEAYPEYPVEWVQSDLFANLQGRRFDVIISNPPYVDAQDMATLPPEYHHEPRLALEAGADGLACVRTILEQAKAHLTDEGILIVEVGNSEEAVREAYPHLPFTWLEFERGGGGVFLLQAKDW